MDPVLRFPFYAKASLVCIGLFAFTAILFFTQDIIVPIIYSTIIAIALSPIVGFLVKKQLNRVLAITITVTLLILFTVALITVLSTQMVQFADSFPVLIEKFRELLKRSVNWTSDNFNISTYKINSWLNEKNAELLKKGSSAVAQTLINTGNALVIIVLIPVYVFMILYYQPLLIQFIFKLFKSNNQKEVHEVLSATRVIIKNYLGGLLLEGAIVALLQTVSLFIIGIDYALLLGVMCAIINVIPYLGGFVAVALPMLIAFVTRSTSSALLVLLAFIIIQLIDNNYLIPKVVASKVKINALVSVIVVLAGGALWGMAGMFLSIPLTAIIKVIFDHIEPLKPWGFLMGNPTSKTQSERRVKMKNIFKVSTHSVP
jgi:predicted PurR-regulated permease PerM